MNHDKEPIQLPLSQTSLKQIQAISKTTYYQHIGVVIDIAQKPTLSN